MISTKFKKGDVITCNLYPGTYEVQGQNDLIIGRTEFMREMTVQDLDDCDTYDTSTKTMVYAVQGKYTYMWDEKVCKLSKAAAPQYTNGHSSNFKNPLDIMHDFSGGTVSAKDKKNAAKPCDCDFRTQILMHGCKCGGV